MAYTSSDLQLAQHTPLSDRQHWFYATSDAQAVWGASSYVSDAHARGVKPGDSIEIYTSSLPALFSAMFKTVRSSLTTTAGSADLSSGMCISS